MNLRKFVFGIATIFSYGFPALALDLDEARELALAGDVDRIHEQFSEHQEDFDSGRIGAEQFKAPYKAFNTTHPKVYETTQSWLDAHPTSPSALAARGGQLVYRADLIRDQHTPGTLPKLALAKIVVLADQATPMLDAALATATNHLAAAHYLNLIGAITRRSDARLRARDVIRKHDDPDHALLAEIRFIDLSSREENDGLGHQFCSSRVEKTPNIALRHCIASVALEQDNLQYTTARDAHAVLSTAPGALFPLAHATEKLYADPETAFTFMESMGGVSWYLAQVLPHSLGPERVLEGLVRPRLEYDPLNPGWLVVLSTIRTMQNDPEAAFAEINRAMEFGEHNTRVRQVRLWLMGFHGDLRWTVTQEFKEAFEDTGGDILFVDGQVRNLLSPKEHMQFNENGSPNEDFPCVRLMYLEHHKAWCEANPSADHFVFNGFNNCDGGVGAERNKVITETRLNAVCGQSVTWKDWFRYLLDLTE
jgi:hypothetical protein